ncbi:MAG: dual specificity protein phosphatase family protein [Anaerolineae bacterium]
MRIANFGWLIEGRLAGSGRPIHQQQLAWLRERGIAAIVSLTERSLRREKLLLHRIDSWGFTYRHIPIADETAPSQAQIDQFVRFVDEMLAQRRGVLAHCAGGYGRTGTMLACYLVSQGWGAEEAMTEVRVRRPGSIAPRAQQASVIEYASRLARAKDEIRESGHVEEGG